MSFASLQKTQREWQQRLWDVAALGPDRPMDTASRRALLEALTAAPHMASKPIAVPSDSDDDGTCTQYSSFFAVATLNRDAGLLEGLLAICK